MVDIKVVYKETVRRFKLPPNASWIDLEAKLRSLFEIPKLTPFTLSYTDEDGDVITLSTDIELKEIFTSNPAIKFNLKFSAPDDSSDSEDSNNEVWVFEGGNISPSKNAVLVTTNETDNFGPQDNIPRKNIVSTTNQEPQYTEDDVNETLIKKAQAEDDFEKVENSSSDCKVEEKSQIDIEEVEKSSNDIERVEESPNDIERVEESPNDIERVEESPNNVEKMEKSPYDIGRVEKSSNDIERVEEKVEKLQTDVDRIERSSIDLDRVERSSNDLDRVENSSIKQTYQVNLLDDDFFESFNSFKISPILTPFEPKPTLASFEPKPIPQREVEDEQKNKETIGTSSSSNTSVFSSFPERIQPQRRQDQNDTIEQFKDMIEQYQDFIKEDPVLTAQVRNVMDQIRSSIPIDLENLNRLDSSRRLSTQSKEGKRNSFFRQQRPGYNRSSSPPIPGRSRSATPPGSGYNRSSTPSRSGYNHVSTPQTSVYDHRTPMFGYDHSSTPPMFRPNTPPMFRPNTPPMLRSSTPPIPGSFPVPSSTPCLWVNEPDSNMNQKNVSLWANEPDSNTNQKNGGSRRSRGSRKRNFYRNRNQNTKYFTKEGEETPERELSESQQESNIYNNEIKQLNDMGFEKYQDQYIELLIKYERDLDQVTEELCKRS